MNALEAHQLAVTGIAFAEARQKVDAAIEDAARAGRFMAHVSVSNAVHDGVMNYLHSNGFKYEVVRWDFLNICAITITW